MTGGVAVVASPSIETAAGSGLAFCRFWVVFVFKFWLDGETTVWSGVTGAAAATGGGSGVCANLAQHLWLLRLLMRRNCLGRKLSKKKALSNNSSFIADGNM